MANYRKSFNLRNGVQVDDDNFIVNANGLVGIGTSVPTEFLDVRGNAKVVGLTTTNTLHAGIATVGVLTVTQGVVVTGVVTATSFSGSASGLTDIYAIAVDGWYVGSGSISTTFNVGVGTTNPQGTLQIGTGVTINSGGSATYSGIVTALSFSGSGIGLTALPSEQLTGTIDNARLSSNISVSGIITAQTHFSGNLVGIASTANSITNTANITVNSINSGFSTTGISTAFTAAYVGTSGTAFAALNSGRIGIGTALPTSELQIRKASASLLEVISDNNQARISIGQSVGVGRSTAVLRFGSIPKSFDIINNDTGNINMYLHNGPSGVGTGRFSWLYGQTNNQLLSLDYDGTLTATGNVFLGFSGISTVTVKDNLYVNGNLNVNGSITGTFSYPSILSGTNLNTNVGITTLQKLNVTANIGINTTSPIAPLDAQGSLAIFGSVGIATTSTQGASLFCNGFASFNSVGIGTTTIYQPVGSNGGALQVHNDIINMFNSGILLNNSINSAIGFGTNRARSILDFGLVGSATSYGYFIVPTVTTSSRNTFANISGLTTVPGAIIYNSTTFKHQGYGSTDGGLTFEWKDLY